MKKLLLPALAIIVCGLVAFALFANQRPVATPFALLDLNNQPVSEKQLQGKVTLINFWYPSCPEFTSHEFQSWATQKGIRIEYIQPGKPQQNAYIERYNRTVRYGLLNQYLFKSLEDIQDCATRWLWFYNHERPHQANGGKPPLMGLDSTETCH